MIAPRAPRWTATIFYRSTVGILDVVHDLFEVEELHDLVEAGPHWDAIQRIEIVRNAAEFPTLTIEEAEQL